MHSHRWTGTGSHWCSNHLSNLGRTSPSAHRRPHLPDLRRTDPSSHRRPCLPDLRRTGPSPNCHCYWQRHLPDLRRPDPGTNCYCCHCYWSSHLPNLRWTNPGPYRLQRISYYYTSPGDIWRRDSIRQGWTIHNRSRSLRCCPPVKLRSQSRRGVDFIRVVWIFS